MMYRLIKPLLFRLDAEQAHDITAQLLRVAGHAPLALKLLRAFFSYHDPILEVECAGLRFANPIGLAAGFDKRGALVGPLAALGFGHIEVGTVTPRPQPGNERPRMFRLPEDAALINRLGFNSPGMAAVARNLRRTTYDVRRTTNDRRAMTMADSTRASVLRPPSSVLGINIGKNRVTPLERAVEDYVAAFVTLAPLADYAAINISSPNTPGLRQLHEREALALLLGELSAINRRLQRPLPLFLKVSPDETPAQLDDVVRTAGDAQVTGFIATNTTVDRIGLRSPLREEMGGLSGVPLTERARRTIAYLYRATDGRMPIIGVGGVASADDAYAHMQAGATLVQLYTGLVYRGPGLVSEIKRGLAQRLRRDGVHSVVEAIGADSL
jgi:dihydroorotate dehydrogenase